MTLNWQFRIIVGIPDSFSLRPDGVLNVLTLNIGVYLLFVSLLFGIF